MPDSSPEVLQPSALSGAPDTDQLKPRRVVDAAHELFHRYLDRIFGFGALMNLCFVISYPFFDPWDVAVRRMLSDGVLTIAMAGIALGARKQLILPKHVGGVVASLYWACAAMVGFEFSQDPNLLMAFYFVMLVVGASMYFFTWRSLALNLFGITGLWVWASEGRLSAEEQQAFHSMMFMALVFSVMSFGIRNALLHRLVKFEAVQRHQTEVLQQSNEALAQERDRAFEASRAKGQFLANMSHELRTPLHTIIGYSELLEEESEVKEGGKKDLETILSAGRNLLALVDELLDMSKAESGLLSADAQTFELRPLLEELNRDLLPVAAHRKNQLTVEMPLDPTTLHTDRARLRQGVSNLLANACKFTDAGRITLRTERVSRDGQALLEFSVTDTGIGMTKEQTEVIFDDFVQVDASVTREFGGTGLGLAITRRITRLLGGELTVTSEPGAGSTFVLCIPQRMPEPVDGSRG